jgi:hypothetical protein
MTRLHLLLSLAAVALLTGCSGPRTLTFLPPADDVRAIVLDDIVRGPESSRLFPMEARYTLKREGDRFTGSAIFSIGSKSPRTATREIVVPLEALERFLTQLTGALLDDGYEPKTAPPGGASPEVRIELQTNAMPVTIFTRSPGADYLPWGVESGGRQYTIVSTAPATAFAELRPYLHRNVLESLAQDAVGPVR